MKAKALGLVSLAADDEKAPGHRETDRWAFAEKLWIGTRAKSMSPWPQAGIGFGDGPGDSKGAKAKVGEESGDTGPAPHWVKAHINHYWVGPLDGVRSRVPRYLAPFLKTMGKSVEEALELTKPSLSHVKAPSSASR